MISRKRKPPSGPASTNAKRKVLLLGPQTREETLSTVLAENGIEGRVATVTAGWQEREDEMQALQAHLDGRADNLGLYHRAEQVFREDAELAEIHHERQGKLRTVQGLYDVHLRNAMATVAALNSHNGDEDLLAEEREEAMEVVRRIDARHLEKVVAIHEEYDGRLALDTRPSLQKHRKEIRKIVKAAKAIAIAGGHVAILLNRLRLFGIREMIGNRPVIGWSAGAMVLTERVVLYHDSPPQGPGNAEVLETGLGLCRGIVPLPHARRRLRLEDPERVGRFARRFSPDVCAAMDEGAWVVLNGSACRASAGTLRLQPDGAVKRWKP